jgi:hypothetical protein
MSTFSTDPNDPQQSSHAGTDAGRVPYTVSEDLAIGRSLSRAVSSYLTQWTHWLAPVCLAGFVWLVGLCACCLPALFVWGPLACGLFGCAFHGLDGFEVTVASLGRAGHRFFTALAAGLVLIALQLVPMFLIFFTLFAVAILAAALGAVNQQAGNAQMAPIVPFVMFPVQLAGVFFQAVWVAWISTRTMFVLPAIADRGCGISIAFDISWEATRSRFWELLFLNIVALVLGFVGLYLCYVGMILTLPLYFLIVAAAYDDWIGRAGVANLSA